MRLPTLTRLPKYKRFSFEPRYYDPVKEDIEQRTSRVKQEIRQLAADDTQRSWQSSIAGSFASKRANDTKNANILQMVILIFLITFIGGYLLYGNDIFYIFLLIVPAYVYIKRKKFFKRR